jgi:hypothetical protein
MSLQTSALDHTCNVARRKIEEDLRDMHLLFIVHKPGERAKALRQKEPEILEHPGGAAMLPELRKAAQLNADESAFIGLVKAEKKYLLGLLRRPATLAVFFLNTDEFEDADDVRQSVYHLAWHAINIREQHKNGINENIIVHEKGLYPHHTQLSLARANMLADVFSSILLEMQGHKSAISKLAYRRSEMALMPVPGYKAELFPFPVVADAAQVVYDDLVELMTSKDKPIEQAMQITQEIDETYDDNSIRQWQAFSAAAQEMAWLGTDKNKILGLSIYTSEDPYVRSTAYLVAEALNLEPAPISDLHIYNPFTDQEANERLHYKHCEDIFQRIIARQFSPADIKLFDDEILAQNARLMEGNPLGWCAYGLLRALDAYRIAVHHHENPAQQAGEIFHRAIKEVNWESLRSVCRMVMHKHRQHTPVTAQDVISFCEINPALILIAETFKAVNHKK